MMKSFGFWLFSLFAMVCPLLAGAVGPDFSGMTSQIDWTTAITAILLIAGGLSAVYVVMLGASLINQKLKSGK